MRRRCRARHAAPLSPRPGRAAAVDVAPHRRVGLGHARLSIIDLATGDQPIASEDERLHIVVNGEFYDFERIQRELEQAGHRLRTRSDSEIALHLYEDLGTQCLHQLRGEFAFVLWDEPNQTALRRPRPLRHQAALLRVARRHAVPRLRGQGAVRRRRAGALGSPSSVYARGRARRPDQDRTLFDGVSQVPPGHYLLATGGHVQHPATGTSTTRTADAARDRARTPSTSPKFRHALDEAVRLRLRADVPVGCYLSGGIDSCAVLGLAARHRPRSDPGLHADLRPRRLRRERRSRARWRRASGPSSTRSRSGRPTSPTTSPTRSGSRETLCINAHGVAKYLLSRAVRDAGYKVVLTGEGSDEILGRLSALPPRHAAVQQRGAGSGDGPAPAGRAGTAPTRSRAACCCPTARRLPLDQRAARARLRALVDGGVLGRGRSSCAALFADDFAAAVRDARRLSRRC